jgi:hypothetical protein
MALTGVKTCSNAIDERVLAMWPSDGEWCSAKIVKYHAATNCYDVYYEEGGYGRNLSDDQIQPAKDIADSPGLNAEKLNWLKFKERRMPTPAAPMTRQDHMRRERELRERAGLDGVKTQIANFYESD